MCCIDYSLHIRFVVDTVIPELNVGQLVKDPYFTLLQAVGALEACVSSHPFMFRVIAG